MLMLFSSIFATFMMFYIYTVPAKAAEASETPPRKEEKSKTPRAVVPNHEIFTGGASKTNAHMGTMQSEYVNKTNQHRLAAEYSRKAIEADPDDMDARYAHGEALFSIIEKGNTDPVIHNECVKTWLIVYRGLVGEEKGLTFKGISIPLVAELFGDSRRDMSKRRLIKLVGRLPKSWETNNKYLSRVLRAEQEVDAKIISEIK